MTPEEAREARESLGLSLAQMATLLGYEDGKEENRRFTMHRIESGDRSLRAPQRRLLKAYLDGYRPDDWPL